MMSSQDAALRANDFARLIEYVTPRHDTYDFINPAKADMASKSVLITGASKGVGRATAASFATAGCSKIALAARSSLDVVEKEVREAAKKAGKPEPQVLSLQVDVVSEESVRAAAEAVTEKFGSLDVLINNAGYLEQWQPIAESNTEEWWRSWEINLKGTYLCSRYLIPLLLKSHTKTLINISSAGGHNTTPGASAYQTAKFTVCRLTEFADKEYYEQGLIALAVHPGGVK
jgi:NAD(P)-dependent dehydrogenase (short-subunit alcohol dehydrogenase family)